MWPGLTLSLQTGAENLSFSFWLTFKAPVMKRYPVDASNFENRSFLYATLAVNPEHEIRHCYNWWWPLNATANYDLEGVPWITQPMNAILKLSTAATAAVLSFSFVGKRREEWREKEKKMKHTMCTVRIVASLTSNWNESIESHLVS